MASKPSTPATASAAAIVAALLLPPLGVYLMHGLGAPFWIAAALTCVGFLPGVVFALVMVLRPDFIRRARTA
ncbi:YqaE/Pmp3 family membrane protein [Sphingomonas profundi]|uniref:YqaE/Pmp3 family membrane protein n=1 Tax=Alterirhizorhabdus profundi TaxID=2681549 RepID=UPI0012E80AD0|nr:YqaE/Pmp3 family membrane protein [Sphingomonas profundi]